MNSPRVVPVLSELINLWGNKLPNNAESSRNKMKIIAEKLNKLMMQKGLSSSKLSEEIGENARTIHNWTTGFSVPRAESLKKLARYFQVPVEVLIGEEPNALEVNLRRIPVISWSQAGAAKDYEDLANQIDDMVDSTTKDPNAFAIEVAGDSMEPEVYAGDRVVLEPNREATNGDMAYVRFSDEAGGGGTIKWYYRVGQREEIVRLVAQNEKYNKPKPIETPKEMILFAYPVINIVRRVQKRRKT